jgi:hypothetical protein
MNLYSLDKLDNRLYTALGLNEEASVFSAEVYKLVQSEKFAYHAAKADEYQLNPFFSTQRLTITSTSNDDNIAGIGAKIAYIRGLNEQFDSLQEAVTLNGTQPVFTQQAFYRVNEFFIVQAGSTNTNQGDILLTAGKQNICCIEAQFGRSQHSYRANYKGKKLVIHDLSIHAQAPVKIKIMLVRNNIHYVMNYIELKGTSVIPLYMPYALEPTDQVYIMTALKDNNTEPAVVSFRASGYLYNLPNKTLSQ